MATGGNGLVRQVRALGAVVDPERRLTMATVVLAELRALQDEVVATRDAAMRALITAGYSYQQVADIAGLSRGRVAQVVRASGPSTS